MGIILVIVGVMVVAASRLAATDRMSERILLVVGGVAFGSGLGILLG